MMRFLLCICAIACAGQQSWEELITHSDQLCSQGKFAEAEPYALRALKIAESFPSTDIRLTESQHHLGIIYKELGRLPEAQKSFERSIATWKATRSGPPKPLISLASLYLENGQYNKAERLLDPWIKTPSSLDSRDPASIRLLHYFAAIQHRQRNYSRAEVLYRQALAAAETTFGPEDHEVALLLNNFGLLLADAGRKDEAVQHLKQAVALWQNALSPDHPNTARSLSNLASLYCSTGAYAAAEPLFQRAMTAAESSLGPDNRLVGTILAEYAVLLRNTKRKKEAKLFESRVKTIRQSNASEDLGRHTIDLRDLSR